MANCIKCGAELTPGSKFCKKCGTRTNVCLKCGKELKPGAKFCTHCGYSTIQDQPSIQAEEKGWFTDGVRAVANAVTGGNLNRSIQREQEEAIRNHNASSQNQNTQRQASEDHNNNEQRARDRRNMAAIEGVDIVRGRSIWNIQPGEVARKIKESELEEIEQLKGVIVQEGCTALIFANGELVSTLSSGAYMFHNSLDEEEAALKSAVEKAKKEINEKEKKDNEANRSNNTNTGLLGKLKKGVNWVGRLIFGEKKNEDKAKVEKRKTQYARLLARYTQPPVMAVYLVSNRNIPMIFGGVPTNEGGINFTPYNIGTKLFDIQVGVSLQLKATDIHAVATNYLADKKSLTSTMLHKMLNSSIENILGMALRNLDYQRSGLSIEVTGSLKAQIMQIINQQLHGIECTQVLQITDKSADFDRFRSIERELYCTEKELDYLQRTGEFRNRLASETNKQNIDKASSEEELRYALMLINKDSLIHDDEIEAFKLMLSAQKRLREAKSQQEEYDALVDLKKSRLVKDEDLEILLDTLAQNKLQRESITEIMRIQHQQNIDDARLMSEWALEEKKIAHDWEREDLERKRNWGIEDEKREREWMHEEQEFNRNFARRQQLEEYDWQRKIRLEDHEWQKAEKERELRWQAEDRQRAIDERQRDLEWEQRKREEEMRRENDQTIYDRNRQDKFDQEQFESGRHQRVMDKLQAMAAIQAQNNAQTYQHEQNMAQINANVQMNRDNAEATMSAEALAAKQISQMDATAQAEFAKMMGSGKENELLQKQQAEQAALYQQMIQMQQNQNTQNQQMMMQMAQMMQQGMTNAANMNMANQQAFHQQQQQFQQQRAEEYKQDAYRQQDRMDANNQLAMGSLSQVTTAAAGNLYTNNTNISVHKSGNSAQFNSKSCPNCGSQLAVEDVFCGECGYSFK